MAEYNIVLKPPKRRFLTVCPRDGTYMEHNIKPITLKVETDSGVDVSPDIDIVVNDLASGRKHFQNNTGDGDRFKIDCVFVDTAEIGVRVPTGESIGSGWEYEYYSIKEMVDYWIRNLIPLNVVTDAVDVPDGLYVIIGNSSRKQSHKGASIWELEFMKYDEINTTTFVSTSTGVTKAIAKYEKAKKKKAAAKKKTTTAKSKTSAKDKLKKCKLSNLKYSKTKKVVTCVKYLQKVLNSKVKSNLIVDGWYGSSTKAAVKKFQTNNKKYNLKTDGNVDQKTLNCLCGSCKK